MANRKCDNILPCINHELLPLSGVESLNITAKHGRPVDPFISSFFLNGGQDIRNYHSISLTCFITTSQLEQQRVEDMLRDLSSEVRQSIQLGTVYCTGVRQKIVSGPSVIVQSIEQSLGSNEVGLSEIQPGT